MSIRESRLCDYVPLTASLCDRPAILTCPVCTKDCCAAHAGNAEIIPTIVFNSNEMVEGRPNVTAIGAGEPVRLCAECTWTLRTTTQSTAVGLTGAHLSFDDLAAKLDGEIVPAVQAWFALQATKKT